MTIEIPAITMNVPVWAIVVVAILGYLAVGVLTGQYCVWRCPKYGFPEGDIIVLAMTTPLFWPLYWLGWVMWTIAQLFYVIFGWLIRGKQ